AAPDLAGAGAEQELFGVADAAGEQPLAAAVMGEAPDLLAFGVGFVGDVAAVADGGVEGVVGNEERPPPVAGAAGELAFGDDGDDPAGRLVAVHRPGLVDRGALGQ